MDLKNKKVGVIMTGSFCTFEKVIKQIKELVKLGADVIPIMSYNSYELDTKFGKAKDIIDQIENITGKKIINTISAQGVWHIVQTLGESQEKNEERLSELAKENQGKGIIETEILYEENDGLLLYAKNNNVEFDDEMYYENKADDSITLFDDSSVDISDFTFIKVADLLK